MAVTKTDTKTLDTKEETSEKVETAPVDTAPVDSAPVEEDEDTDEPDLLFVLRSLSKCVMFHDEETEIKVNQELAKLEKV